MSSYREPSRCGVDHSDATCDDCGAEHVEVGWAHICRDCWDRHINLMTNGPRDLLSQAADEIEAITAERDALREDREKLRHALSSVTFVNNLSDARFTAVAALNDLERTKATRARTDNE